MGLPNRRDTGVGVKKTGGEKKKTGGRQIAMEKRKKKKKKSVMGKIQGKRGKWAGKTKVGGGTGRWGTDDRGGGGGGNKRRTEKASKRGKGNGETGRDYGKGGSSCKLNQGVQIRLKTTKNVKGGKKWKGKKRFLTTNDVCHKQKNKDGRKLNRGGEAGKGEDLRPVSKQEVADKTKRKKNRAKKRSL